MSKLDRLVGVKVFGWAVRESEDGEAPSWATNRATMLDCQYHAVPLSSGPNFSTDIAAAWEVVEHLRTRKEDPMVITMLDNDDGEYVIAFATRADRWTTRELGKNRDAPMAICLAALKAFGVSESEIQEAMR